MDIRQLESFVVVAEQGSFSEAARILHISQPSISTHVSSLENELGMRLFNRTTKKVALTSQGREIYEYAIGIFNLTRRIRELGQNPHIQTLQIGASSVPSAYMLPDIMKGFMEENQDCRIVLRQSDSAIVVEELIDGVCDLGIVGDVIKSPNLKYTLLLTDRNVLITANNEHFQNLLDEENAIRDILANEHIIMRENGSGSRRFFDKFLNKNDLNFSAVHIAAFCNDMEAVKSMVAKGIGVSIAPLISVRKEIDKGELLGFELAQDTPEDMRRFYMVTKDGDKKRNTFKKHFAAYVKNVYKNEGED